MPYGLTKPFNNFANADNPTGVCEAAVCLWQQHIKETVGTFQMGRSAGDWVPNTAVANSLYQKFDTGTEYPVTYMSFLNQHVYSQGKGKSTDVDANGANGFIACCHYSGSVGGSSGTTFQTVLENMVRGDTLFFSLTGVGVVGHAMGAYRGTDYFFVFDPNAGLYKGQAWDTASCCKAKAHELASAASTFTVTASQHSWTQNTYLGLHLR